MATNFFEIGKGGASRIKTVDYGRALDPIVDKVNKMAEESKAKTEALINAMPQGVPIDKVPEELRGQVTEFLAQGKQDYLEASKVIASGIRPTDPRYIDAMATINGVNNKFRSLSEQLEDVALKRQAALDNRDHSDGAFDWEINDHENLANGSLKYNQMARLTILQAMVMLRVGLIILILFKKAMLVKKVILTLNKWLKMMVDTVMNLMKKVIETDLNLYVKV